MRVRPTLAAFGVFAALALAAPAAHAFTMENNDAKGAFAPKFDLGEQARQFRKDGADTSSTPKQDFSTPFGSGSLEFGVRQGSSNFGSFGPSFGPSYNSTTTRQDFERVVTPPSLR